MIIDIYGLPGSGKSTLSLNIQKMISENADYYDVYFFNKNEYDTTNNISKNLWFYLKLIDGNFWRMYNKISRKIIRNKKIKHQKIKYKIRDAVRLSILYSFILSKVDEEKIFIIDQGIIQDFIELLIKYGINEDYIIRDYLNMVLLPQIVFVFCDVCEEQCVERIRKRNRKDFDFDFLSDDELYTYFMKEQKYIKKIDELLADNVLTVKDNSNEKELLKILKRIKGE